MKFLCVLTCTEIITKIYIHVNIAKGIECCNVCVMYSTVQSKVSNSINSELHFKRKYSLFYFLSDEKFTQRLANER